VLLVLAIAGLLLLRRTGGEKSPGGERTGGSLIASLRSEPANYNRYVDTSAAADLLSLLMHARLVRINRATDELEPALAESWTPSADGLSYTLKLRHGVQFSDGHPFTSDDVLFTARALYDPAANTTLASLIAVNGKPLVFEAPDPATVIVRFPSPYAPGLRLLDSVAILPKHKLEGPLGAGTFAAATAIGTPPAEIVGLGPFVMTEHVTGQRMVFGRNPHYWKRDANGAQLPYLDRLTVAIVPDQNAEALRMQSGEIDLMSNGDIRADDVQAFRRASDQGKLRLLDVGIGLDPNLLWFNLTEPARSRLPLFHQLAFRQAVSYAVDRDAIVNTVYLGAAVPVFGPVTPGNKTWYSDAAPKYPLDRARARALLASLKLADTDGDGLLEDARRQPVRFSIIVQQGNTIRERTASVIQEQLRQVGIGVDIAGMDPKALFARYQSGDFDTIYHAVQMSSSDPTVGGADFWFSSGSFHAWNPGQKTPATQWEARIDTLMHRIESAPALTERQLAFAEVQKIFGEQVPAIYLAAPKMQLAISSRVANPHPAPQIPQLLWSADTLQASGR